MPGGEGRDGDGKRSPDADNFNSDTRALHKRSCPARMRLQSGVLMTRNEELFSLQQKGSRGATRESRYHSMS